MPIQLIVAALIAAGAAGGTGGAALGGKGAIDMNAARKKIKNAEADYASARKKTEMVAEKTNQALVDYGSQKEESLRLVVMRLGDFLRRHAKQVKDAGGFLSTSHARPRWPTLVTSASSVPRSTIQTRSWSCRSGLLPSACSMNLRLRGDDEVQMLG